MNPFANRGSVTVLLVILSLFPLFTLIMQYLLNCALAALSRIFLLLYGSYLSPITSIIVYSAEIVTLKFL